MARAVSMSRSTLPTEAVRNGTSAPDGAQRHTRIVADAHRPRDPPGIGKLEVHVSQGNPAS